MVTLEFKTLNLRNGLKLDYKTQLTEIIRNVAPLDPQGQPKRGFLSWIWTRPRVSLRRSKPPMAHSS